MLLERAATLAALQDAEQLCECGPLSVKAITKSLRARSFCTPLCTPYSPAPVAVRLSASTPHRLAVVVDQAPRCWRASAPSRRR